MDTQMLGLVFQIKDALDQVAKGMNDLVDMIREVDCSLQDIRVVLVDLKKGE